MKKKIRITVLSLLISLLPTTLFALHYLSASATDQTHTLYTQDADTLSEKATMSEFPPVTPDMIAVNDIMVFEGSTTTIIAVDDDYLVYKNSKDYFMDVKKDDTFLCETPMILIYTQPVNGIATIVGNTAISYTPTAEYVGRDSLRYIIHCGDTLEADTATVHINVIYADNIPDVNCFVEPPASVWDMEVSFLGDQELNSMITPVVGDLDGDGIPEIIAVNHTGNGYQGNSLYVYYGNDRSNPKIIEVKGSDGFLKDINCRNMGAIAIAKVDLNNDGVFVPIIIVHNTDGILRAYNPAKATGYELVWESDDFSTHHETGYEVYTSLHIADFNNDGHPEVYTSTRIFDAATGKLLVKANNTDKKGGYSLVYSSTVTINFYHTHAADICGDARLELVAGTQVFDVQINSRTNPTANTMFPIRSIPDVIINGCNHSDGNTLLVDINQDGRLDVVYTSLISSDKRIAIVAWDVEKQEIIAEVEFNDDVFYGSTSQAGIPFVGDVDGDGKLELLILSTHRIYSFFVNKSTKKFEQKWAPFVVQDESGATGITLFDFNLDGVAELVYRDEKALKILNATSSGLVERSSIEPCRSGTVKEYPIVADVDNDGYSEIIVIGIPVASGDMIATKGSLHIIKSKNPCAWAPARPVWNQYAYNAVNINSDLTVPKFQLNPATFFPGEDGILGTSDDVQPFNNFLQQQALLNKNGLPLWSAPDAVAKATLSNFSVSGTTLTVNLGFTNDGNASIGSPVYVTLYAGSIDPANIIATDSMDVQVNPGGTEHIIITIDDISELSLSNIIVVVNDNGTTFPYQEECDISNNIWSFSLPVYRWWYLSTPYSNATANTFNFPVGTLGSSKGSLIGYYREANKKYDEPITNPATVLKPGFGIVTSLDTTVAAFNPPVLSMFNGSSTNSNVTVIVTNTDDDGISGQSGKEGKNLLGNPYNSPIDFNSFYAYGVNSNVIQGSYWIRGWNRNTNKMTYDTYNSSGSGTGNINGIALTEVIPVIQGFWVQATSSDTVTFNSSITTTATAPNLRFSDANIVARLTVRGEKASDQTLIVLNPNALNSYDMYDSEKMSNYDNEIPEIYTKIGSRELAINGISTVTDEFSTPLGFRTGKDGSFTISSVFENWDNTKLFLRDNTNGIETELTTGSNYSFTSGVCNNTNRFTIIIKESPAGVNDVEHNTRIFVNKHNRIVIETDILNAEYNIYNTLGQQLNSGTITLGQQILDYTLDAGVYLVKVGNKTEKVIIE